jgi:O-antigen/teichoic acid export membrane protein
MKTPQRVAKNTFALLVSGAALHAFSFLAMVWLGRVLSPDSFGKINFAMAVASYFVLLTNFGLPLLGTRELAKDHSVAADLVAHVFLLRIVLAVCSFTLLSIVAWVLPNPGQDKLLILLFGGGIFFSALSIDWVFQAMERMEFIGIGRFLAGALFLALVFFFVSNDRQLVRVPVFQAAGGFLSAAALLSVFVSKYGFFRFTIHWARCKSLLVQALPLGVSILLIQVIYNIDTVMLGFLRSEAEVGYYNAAYKIILALILVGAVYFDAVFPIISRHYENSLDDLRALQAFNAKFMATAVFPLVLFSFCLAHPIIGFVFGEKYEPSVEAFQILTFTVGLVYLNMIYARGMWACNRQKQYVWIALAQASANVALNLLLIPPFGMTGAAASTVAAELLGLYFYHRDFNTIVRVPILDHIRKPLLACALMLPVFILSNRASQWLGLLVFLSGYGAILYGIGGITKKDVFVFFSIFRTQRSVHP